MKAQTPMMRQYLEVKSQHPDKLVFFRLGDFYEMFFDDAVEASRALEITLTSRNKDKKGKPIPMCGVPHHSANGYLSRLIKQGYKVAICEQVEEAAAAKGIVRRKVTRVVTPGTVTDEDVLESGRNNYLAALTADEDLLGLSFLDLSTGEFWVTEARGEGCWAEVDEYLAHFAPAELVLPEKEAGHILSLLSMERKSGLVETPRADWTFHSDYAAQQLLDHFKVSTLEGFGIEGKGAGIAASGALLHYVKETQKSQLEHITRLLAFESSRFLKLDESTVANLELVRGSDGNRKWTLLASLDETRTGMGARLLRSWVLRPSLDLSQIRRRHEAVDELRQSVLRLGELRELLASIHDVERLLARVILEKANARDLLALKDSVARLPEINQVLSQFNAEALTRPLDEVHEIHDLLSASIHPAPPISISEGRLIRDGHSSELDQLREISTSGKSYIARLEASERERSGISSLKIRYNKVFGYFIEVTRAHSDRVPEDYVRKQTLVNAERFITAELKDYEEKVLGAEEKIIALERSLFISVRSRVADQVQRLQVVSTRLGQLDVLQSFAHTAQARRYQRPMLDDSTELVIQGGRHPVLELQSSDPFVPNDLICNTTTDQLLILTGPNMGGKSTYLRQNALIVLMAQMGSFVPVEEARIGLVDRIYTRVGASDNLSRGRSTFMVEMIETANILNTATQRSLVLLDEVGRGTATFDGLSLAWSIAEYLHNDAERSPRTLFATHYHELTKLENLYDGVRNYSVSVRESGGEIIFFHRVKPGTANRSYGIEVARLAGLPTPVLERAREILTRLERKRLDLAGKKKESSADALEELQRALF